MSSNNFQKYIGKSAKYVVSFTVGIVILINESTLPLYYVTSAVTNSIFGKIIKRIVKQPRPIESPKLGYGMPSSHTNAITFFTTVLFFKSNEIFSNPYYSIALNTTTITYTLLACSWRIRSHLHSVSQIAVGALLGFTSANLALYAEPFLVRYVDAVAKRDLEDGIPRLFMLKVALVSAAIPVIYGREIVSLLKRFLK